MSKQCSGIFDHSMEKMETLEMTTEFIVKRCPVCGFTEKLARSSNRVMFLNGSLLATKKWAADDNAKETLQPLGKDGSVNDDFTEAYGYNPFDNRTKEVTPKVQGGNA